MKSGNWKAYAAGIGLCEVVGMLSGLLTRRGVEVYLETVAKPPLSPPGVVFPIVWTVLFALMGAGAARVWLAPASAARSRGLRVFAGQLVVNFCWSLLFFNGQWFGPAFFWLVFLWGLILWMTALFGKVDRAAAGLQIPYAVWVAFAAYLNLGVWVLNR